MSNNVERIARVCHEANRAYCAGLGDDSQYAWLDAPGWQRESALNGVQAHLDNPSMTPEQSHESWLREKERTGWTYGSEKNVELKRHPCFVPYEELPAAQQVKDALFKAVVDAMREH